MTSWELRTRSLDIASVQIGAVAFYDAGVAGDLGGTFDPRTSAGGGLRIVLPQVDRAVFRIDIGIPLSAEPRPADVPPVALFVAFHQALALTALGDLLRCS